MNGGSAVAIEALGCNEIKLVLREVASAMDREKVQLSDLDSYIGDGDHGVGMANGFRIGIEDISKANSNSIEEVLRIVSEALVRDVGGVSGSVFGSVFLGMSQAAKDKEHLSLTDFEQMFSKGLELAQKRGGAVPGDKTMIDALHPAVESLRASVSSGNSIAEAFTLAAESARSGAEGTRQLSGKRGRAKYFREKAIGFQDAGATSVAVIVEAMAARIKQLEQTEG
jgi:dihydroxyacetone kinase phosphoprotein-dependent L subunit